jgi:hypothetical protein
MTAGGDMTAGGHDSLKRTVRTARTGLQCRPARKGNSGHDCRTALGSGTASYTCFQRVILFPQVRLSRDLCFSRPLYSCHLYMSTKNNIFCRRDLHLPVSARLTRLMRLAMIFSRKAILLTVNPEQECCSYCLSPGHLGKILFD